MADNIENHIINLQAKLQLLLKKHALLNKEIEQFRKENVDITSKIKSLHERNQQLIKMKMIKMTAIAATKIMTASLKKVDFTKASRWLSKAPAVTRSELTEIMRWTRMRPKSTSVLRN